MRPQIWLQEMFPEWKTKYRINVLKDFKIRRQDIFNKKIFHLISSSTLNEEATLAVTASPKSKINVINSCKSEPGNWCSQVSMKPN
jgi:hypothetical protein